MTEQQKFEAWADAVYGPAPGAIPQHERYASLFEVWQARATQDKSAELLEALDRYVQQDATHGMTDNNLYRTARAAISKARGE